MHLFWHFGVHTRIDAASLQWRHIERDGVLIHRRLDCLLNRLFRHRSKKTKFRVIGLCVRNSLVTDELPAQRVSNPENVSVWWRYYIIL